MKFATIIDALKSPFMKYNEWTMGWEKDKRNMEAMQKPEENPITGWGIAISQVKPNSKVLSVGCGPGREVNYLVRKLNCDVIGIDHSKEMIRLSKINEPKAKYYVADMVNFKSYKKFDYITCLWNTINFLPNLEARKKFIKSSYNNLKKNGYLIITTGDRNASLRTFFRQMLFFHKNYYPKPSQIDKWFEDVKFKVYRSKINSETLLLCQKL